MQVFTRTTGSQLFFFNPINIIKKVKQIVACALIMLLASSGSQAQISVTSSSPVTQNFDAMLGTSATAALTTNQWRVADNAGGATWAGANRTATTQAAGTAANFTSGGIYNFGDGATATATDRALGFLSSGTTPFPGTSATPLSIYAQYVNATGATIQQLTGTFNIEKYRGGTNAQGWSMNFFYSLDGSTWFNVTSGNQVFPADANNNVLPTVNSTLKTYSITGLNIPNAANFYLRWTYFVSSGTTATNAQGIGIDNVSLSAMPTINTSGTLSAVNTTYGTASPVPTSFSVTGANLTNDIVVTAPAGYEVSQTAGGTSGYALTQTITQSGGLAGPVTIYARLSSMATVAGSPYTSSIVLSTAGAFAPVNVTTVSSTVTPLQISTTGAVAVNKEYDRTTAAAITGATAVGTINGDIITVTGGGNFSGFLVGTGIPVTAALTLSGTNATSYTINPQPTGLSADITVKPLTIGSAQAHNKVFDGNTDAVITGTLNGVISPDVVTLSGSGTFASSAVGNNISVTSTSTIGGADAANYSLTQPTGLTANITPAGLTPQTINFTLSSTAVYGDAPVTLNGTATSGLTVTYVSSNPAVASVSGNTLTILTPGFTNITASQPGDGTYDIAPDVVQSLTVSPKNLTVTGPVIVPNKVYNGNTTAIIDVSGASLFGVVNPDVVTLGGDGNFGSPNVGTAIPVTANLTLGGADAFKYSLMQPTGLAGDITQAPQTINFTALAPKTFNDPGFSLTATATSGLTVTYASSNPSVATVSGSSVTIIGAGTTNITASQAGNANYAAAADVVQALLVNPASQVITLNPIPNQLYVSGGTYLITQGSSTSGLTLSYSSSDPLIASISGSTINLLQPGTVTITANQAGNANYSAALPQSQPFTIVPVSPFAPVPMASQPGKSYTENFNGIGIWYDGFAGGVGANRWKPVNTGTGSIPSVNSITAVTSTFLSPNPFILSGVYRGTDLTPASNSIGLVSTGGTDNTSSVAIDFFMDYTGEIAGKLSFDAATVINAAASSRYGTLRVYASPDGTTWSELTGTNLPYITTNQSAANATISNIQLPASFNGSATAVLRFYYHNGGLATGSGNRPVITIDNLTVTALLAPAINSSLTAPGTVNSLFTYNITGTNTPTSFNATGQPAWLNINTISGVLSGTPTASGVYNINISATNAAGTDNKTLVLTVGPGNQTITFNPLAAVTYGDAPFTLNGTSTSGLAVSYNSSDPSVATVSGNTVTIVGGGSTIITASQAGNADWNAATQVTQTLTVNKANQTITFGPLANKIDTDPPFNLTAISSSGLTVSYSSSNPAVATVSGNTVTIVGPGTTVITASQAGDLNYNGATSVQQTQLVFNSSLLNQTISFAPLANKTYGDASFQLTATGGGSTSPVTYVSSDPSVASVSGDIVTINGAGTTNITASQAGDANYNAAPDVIQPLVIDPKTLTTTGITAQNKVYDGNTNATLEFSGSSVFGIINSDDVAVGGGGAFADANVATAIPVTANLILSGPAAPNYTIVQPTGLSADITQASQTITFNTLADKTTADAPFALTGIASSGLTVSYTSSNPLVATVSGNTVTIVAVGSTVITASQAGNINYTAATAVPQTLTVTQGSQTITFNTLPNKLLSDAPFALTATASSGLTVSYTSSNPAVATVSGNTVTIVAAGTTNITALQNGDVNFAAATPVVQPFTVIQSAIPVPMAIQPLRTYTEDFNDITNWTNGFVTGAGASRWSPVGVNAGGIPLANSITVSTATFVTATSQGVQKGSSQTPATTSIVLLAINASDNINASAIDFFIDFTGVVANKLSFDAATVFNSTGNRVGTLHVYASTDGSFWTELTGTDLPYVATNNVAGSASISNIQLPGSFSNSATARLRFYIHNGTGGTTGSRPKISIDNLTVSGYNAPVINSSLSDNATYNSAYSYTITATNGPTGYNATGLPAGLNFSGNTISGSPTVTGTFNITIEASNPGGTDSKILVLNIAKANQTITGLPATDTKTFGDAAYNLSAIASSGLTVTYASSDPSVATITGNQVTITGGGTTTITASQTGDANYNAAPDVTQTLTVSKANQTITFGALPNKLNTDPPYNLGGTASSGLTVSYISSNPSVATVSGNTVTIVGPGTTIFTASQAGDANYNAAPDVSQTQIIFNAAAANQTITFNPLSNKTYGDAAFQLTASASSSLPVSYVSSDPTVASISGDMVTILKPGTITITASQPGDIVNYNPAPDVSQSLTIDPKPLTVTGAVAQNKVYDGNNAATILGATLVGVINPDIVTVSGGGTFGSVNVASAITVSANLSLGGADASKYTLLQPTGLTADITIAGQTITFGALVPKTVADGPFALTATSTSGLTVSYSSSNPAVATVSGNTVTIVSDGTTTITASQAGNGNYSAATAVAQTLLVTPAVSVVMWDFGTSTPNAPSVSPVGGTVPSGLTVSTITVGNNNGTTTLLQTTNASNTYPGASGAYHAASAVISGSLSAKDNTGTLAGTSTYLEFTLSPSANKKVTLNSLQFGWRKQGATGPEAYTLRSSLDNYVADLATESGLSTINTWSLRTPVTTATTSGYGAPVTYRLYAYGGAGAVANTVNWRVDDIALSLLLESLPACTGTPVAGTASAGTSAFCTSGSTTITLTGYTDPASFDGISLQWYSSTDNITFNPLPAQTNPTLATGTVTQTTYYYCVVSCSNSGLSATSNTVTVTVTPQPATPSIAVVNNHNGTSTLTASGYTGTLLWSTSQTINPIVVNTANTYSVTQTIAGCTSAAASVYVTPDIEADPAVGGMDITDMSDASIPDANQVPFNQVLKVKIPIYNLNQDNQVPAGSTTFKLDLGTKFVLDPGFVLATAALNNYFAWTSNVVSGHVIITGNQIADIPADFIGTMSFQIIAPVSCTSLISSNLIVDNHAVIVPLVDEATNNNSSTLIYSVVVPSPTVSVDQPTCAVATGTINITAPTATGMTYSIDGMTYTNTTGVFPGLTAGSYNVTAKTSDGCVSAITVATVNPQPPTFIPGTVSGTSPLCIGATTTYTTTGDAGGVWSSSNALVASVNASGLVTALSAGTTNITYSVGGCTPASSFQSLTVNPNANAGTVSGTSPLCIGATATYTSTGDGGGVWSSTNPLAATVNASSGLVTAVGAGTTDITYTLSTGCNLPASSFQSLTVNPNANAGTVSGTSPLCIGATATYTSTGDAGGVWSSTNPLAATVNASSGLVTAVGAGTTDITYTLSTGCNLPASSFQSLTVNPNANAGTVSGTSPLCIGATATYTSTGDAGGVWSSTNPLAATVNASSGLVTAVGAGTTDITYTVSTGCNPPSGSFQSLTVNPNANAGTVSGTSPLCIGATATYTSTGDAGGVWSSTNPLAATVNASSGLVTAVGAGTTDITYTLSTGCNLPASSFQSLTVNPNANAGTVSGTSPLCIGATATYTSTGDAGGVWSSTNPLAATVNASSGLVTAVGAGTTDITYTVSTGCNPPSGSFQSLTVNPNANAGTVSGTSPLCNGSTATYTSTGDAGGVWSSTNPLAATVNASSGLVTAVGAGTTDITYTVTGCAGTQSAFQTLTVNAVPPAPSIGVAYSIGTATLTASGYTGTLLWNTNETTNPIVVTTGGTYTVTQTVNGCTSPAGSVVVALNVIADPAVTGLDITDLSDVSIPDANFAPLNQVLKLKVPVFNLNQVNAVPAGSVTLRIDLGSKFVLDPGFTLATAPLNNYFNWTSTVLSGHVIIFGDLYADLPADFNGIASFQVISSVSCSSSAGATIIVDNHASLAFLIDEDAANNNATMQYSIVVPSPTVSVDQPTCAVATGTINITAPTATGMTYSIDGMTYTNTTGVFPGLTAGSYNVTAKTSDGCVSAITVATVNPQPPTFIPGTVSGTSPLCIGATTTYTTTGDAGGVWSSSNALVASVNASGLVTALSAGTTNITYSVGGCTPASSFQSLTVNPNANAGTVSGTSPLCIGATATYTSTGDGGGVWSSTNPLAATVNASSGLVTAVGAGTTDITYTLSTGCNLPASSFQSLTVNPNANAGTVSGTSPLCIGATATYTSTGDAGGVWSSTNPLAATVNASSGLVTAVGAGTTDITYTLSTGCNLPASSFQSLTVNPNANAGTVSGTSPLCIGATATYTSTGDAGGVWSSTNPLAATVNASSGLVTAVGAGTTDITYTVSTGCNPPSSSFQSLTVNPNANAGTVSGTSPLCIGATATYTSTGDAGGVWSSTNPLAATVNASSGLVTAVGAGTTDITYTLSTGCNLPASSFQSLTVNPNANAGTVSGTSPLCIGATATYTSTGDAGGVWSSTNPLAATVNASSGLVTAVGAGTTDITYTVSTGCNPPSSSFQSLTVNANANAGTVSGTSPLCIGATATYTSTGDAGGVWSSTNPLAATVNASSGLVTAVGAGTTDITYTTSGGCNGPVSSFQTLTVNGTPPAPSISAVYNPGGTVTLTASGYTGTLLWSTSETTNPIIVNASGTYTVTQTVNGCTSAAGSVIVILDIAADPAVTGLDITDLSDVSIPDANFAPLNQVLKLKVPVFNLNQVNPIPAGSTTLRIDLGSKFILDPGFTLATASLNNYFNWTETVEAGNVVIYGDQYAEIPADFDAIAIFQVIANTSCSSDIDANIIVDNHASAITLLDEDINNNAATLLYSIVVPAPVVSTDQPTCAVPTGTITVSSPTAAGMTYSINGVDYSNTTGVFTSVAPGSYNVTAQTADGCISAITVAVVNPVPVTPTTITYTVTQPDCFTATGTITVTSPLGLTYSIDGVDYSNTSGVFPNLTPGSYNLTARPVAGCTSSITVVVVNPQPIPGALTYNVIQPDCGTPTGTITVLTPLGSGLGYSVDGLDYTNTTGVFTGLTPGTYGLTVKTSAGCVSPVSTITIIAPPPTITLTLGAVTSTGCSGSPVGSIQVTASGTPGPFTYTIAGPTVNTTGQTSGIFTGLSAGNYTITATAPGSCSNSIDATVVGPTGTVPDISLGSEFSNNLFFNNGDINTVVYNISEVAGNPSTGDTLRITKVPGYIITFNGSLTANPFNPLNTLDNPRWKIANSAAFVSIIFDPLQNGSPGTLNCGERVFVAIDIQRNTPNVQIFNLSARLRKANLETFLINNLNNIVFTAE